MAGRDEGLPADSAASDPARAPEVIGTGFLLSSLGAHSAMSFAKRIEPMGLTPPHVGLLRAIAVGPGRSQQSIADEFGMPPSRVVGFIDDLEATGLVERRRDDRDRRVHRLYLTPAGGKAMRRLAELGKESEETLLGSLDAADRKRLRELLERLVVDQQLTPGVHPGYRRMQPEKDVPTCD
ncbi:MAG TPA: MarR family winged helix-turn-helix transcriptional regulator [Mycobacteriales bacterium]|jgi:DNA-binding MarR family transcriptional regulator|nr:MarR family winged helix-turn-helix transcriptional regulator [Mycobacteriales bacterium]